jgi:RND family efflux transporter MFP subunit
VISKLLAQPGQIVLNGGELMRLIRDGRLEWRAELPVAQLAAVAPGNRVELRTVAGARVDGRVRSVSPGVDAATRTGTVFVDLPKPEGLLSGAYLEGRIDTGTAQAATVPAAAVVLRDGFPTVFVVGRDGVAQARRIRTGAKAGQDMELLDGPKPGEQVIVRGAGFVADGDRVRVVSSAAAPASASP